MATERSRARRAYIDWLRGLAVLLMIEAHTVDAWTRPASRIGRPFAYATMLGGMAAPLFLWLAGLGVALSASRVASESGSRGAAVDAICRRGLMIFVLAFLFRLQAFIVTPGNSPLAIFRVDILNIMGPAIAAAGLLWGVTSNRSVLVLLYAVLATATAMMTPVVRDAMWVDALPPWIQWHLRPAGEYTNFTLFPWSGFVFAGAACGVVLAAIRGAARERVVHLMFAAVGLSVTMIGFATAAQPSIYAHSSFWTSSPAYFAIRIGLMMLMLAAAYMLSELMTRRSASGRTVRTAPAMISADTSTQRWSALAAFERFGRSSLFVYWIHVELVYGYATWMLRHRLPLWGTAVAFGVFSALMYAAVLAKDHWQVARRARLYTEKNIAV